MDFCTEYWLYHERSACRPVIRESVKRLRDGSIMTPIITDNTRRYARTKT